MEKAQIHKRLGVEAVKEVLEKYTAKLLDLEAARAQLGVGRSRFFDLVRAYRKDKNSFSIQYERVSPKRISVETEELIANELLNEKKLVEDPKLPVTEYNYAAVHDTLRDKALSPNSFIKSK